MIRFILLLSLLVLSACTDRDPPRRGADQAVTAERPEIESWNVRFSVSQAGRMRVQFESPHLVQFRRSDSLQTYLRAPAKGERRVRARLFDPEGKQSATLTARELRYSNKSGTYEATGEVRVAAANGRRLETEHLIWLEDERKVRTTDYVRIITQTEQLQGYDLVADENLDTYTLAHPTGILTIEEGE